MDPEVCEGGFPWTAFHCACHFGHLDIVKYFVEERNCNLECRNGVGDHPLHDAVWGGNLNIVKYLIEERGANPMCTGKYNENILHYACRSGNLDMLKYIEEKCPNLSCDNADLTDTTPLHVAAQSTTPDVLKYLLNKKQYKEKGRDHHDANLLLAAAGRDRLEIVKYLIQEQEFDPESANEVGRTPLHVACMQNSINVVKFLIEEMGVNTSCHSIYGNSPVHTAVKSGSLDVVKYLFEGKHCDLNCYDNNGFNPLHSAASEGNLNIVKYLIGDQGCDPRCLDSKSCMFTPLHLACGEGNLDVVKYLLEEAKVGFNTEDKLPPLHCAAGTGHLEVVKLLVEEYQCDPSAKDLHDTTAAEYAKRFGHGYIYLYLKGIKGRRRQLKAYNKKAQPTGKVLGSGTYGRVVEMISETGRVMAGKIFRLPAASAQPQDKLAHSMQKEMMTMVQLQHPNIVEYMGVCYLPDQSPLPVVLMEKLMTSLHVYLLDPANCNLGVIRKLSFLLDTVRGLEYLHSCTSAIIHRDLTARNVLLDFQLRAKISDFGNAQIMDLDPNATPGTSTAQPGTLDYMPPETIGGSAISDPSLDVFSFGHLALFTLLQTLLRPLLPPTYTDSTGKIQGRSEVERRGEFVKKAKSVPLGRPLLDLISQCLQNEPSQRPKSGELLPRLQEMKKTLGKWHATMQ